jgi:iron complex outermembrane receptor protein
VKVILAFVLLVVLTPSFAQQSTPQAASPDGQTPASQSQPAAPPKPEEAVLVTGTFEPIPLLETQRSVMSIDVQQAPLLFSSDVDYLRLDPSIDLQERAPGGVQADLSIRGSTFGQTLVLIDGLRVNDAQTGHHNLDLPIPLDSIDRIEMLHGAGSTFYGADAMGGAVNFVTAPPAISQLRIRAGIGNFGYNEQRAVASYSALRWSEEITADRSFSTGFMPDRDFRSAAASSETHFQSALGGTTILLSGADRPFGANQFYGPFESWERTKGWFAALTQDLGKQTVFDFGYRRHSDEFILLREAPSVYENNHVTDSWQVSLRRHGEVAQNTTISYGAEGYRDQIDSNNLGHHGRNRGAIYAAVDFRALRRVSVSLGAREESYNGARGQFTPSASAAYWISSSFKVRGAVSRAFRIPTYTDLYYSDPANVGNPNLRPESAWSYEGGFDWNSGGRVSVSASGFYRREHDGIDYVKCQPGSQFNVANGTCVAMPGTTDVWHAYNIDNLHFTGVETLLRYKHTQRQEFDLGYSGVYGAQQALNGLESQYVFNYATHNAFAGWQGALGYGITARTRIGVTQRYQRDAYPLWDFSVAREEGRFRPYLQLTNLSNTSYAEIQGVRMPGRAVIGGLELIVFSKKR